MPVTAIILRLGDCNDVMPTLNGVGIVCCDPPYGLEFGLGLGVQWDSIGNWRPWEAGGGFSKPGIGERKTAWPSFSAMNGPHGTANPTCAVCGGRLRGKKKCSCEQPHDHWKPIGKRRGTEQPQADPVVPLNAKALQGQGMQTWHTTWLEHAYAVLPPGGIVMAFGGTRVYHRLAVAMEDAGFTRVRLEAWSYGSGFPKSHDTSRGIDRLLGCERAVISEGRTSGKDGSYTAIVPTKTGYNSPGFKIGFRDEPASDEAKTWDGWGTALKPAWEPILVGVKP